MGLLRQCYSSPDYRIDLVRCTVCKFDSSVLRSFFCLEEAGTTYVPVETSKFDTVLTGSK
jgi:hypothetical protein